MFEACVYGSCPSNSSLLLLNQNCIRTVSKMKTELSTLFRHWRGQRGRMRKRRAWVRRRGGGPAPSRQDQAKGLRFNLQVKHIQQTKKAQNNRCAACNIELLWSYQPKDLQQFSVDRKDNTKGHTGDNIRLTCLECNRKRGAADINA